MRVLLLFITLIISLGANSQCPYEIGSIFVIDKQIALSLTDGESIKKPQTNGLTSLIIKDSSSYGCVADMEVFGTNEVLNTGNIYVEPEELSKIRKTNLVRKLGDSDDLVTIIKNASTINSAIESKPMPPKREVCEGCEHGNLAQLDLPIPKLRPKNHGKQTPSSSSGSIANMRMSPKGIDLIKEFEGFSGGFHKDGERKVGGKWVNIPAIGHGYQVPTYEALKAFCRNILKSPPGTPKCKAAYREWKKIIDGSNKSKNIIDRKIADRALKAAVAKKARHFKSHFKHLKITQSQYDALMSLMYNYPKGFYSKFGTNLYKELRKSPPNMLKVAEHMHDVGPRQGHFRRRLHEIHALLYGDYGVPSKSTLSKARKHKAFYQKLRSTWLKKASDRKINSSGKPFWVIDKRYYSFMKGVVR